VTPLKHRRRANPKQAATAAVACSAASEAKQRGESTAPLDKSVAKAATAAAAAAAQKVSAHAGPAPQPKTGNTTSDQAISVFSQQGQVRARRQASTQTTVDVTRPSHIGGPFSFKSESPHGHWYPYHACGWLHLHSRQLALVILENGRGLFLDLHRGGSRRPRVVLASPRAEAGGNAQPKRRRKRKKEKEGWIT